MAPAWFNTIAHSQILNLSRRNILAISRTFWRHVLFHLGLLRNEPQRPLSPSLYSAHHYFTHLTLILIRIVIIIITLILIAIPINSFIFVGQKGTGLAFRSFPASTLQFWTGYGIWELHYISLFFGCWKYRWSMQRSHYKGERSYSWVTNYWEGGMMDWRPQDQCQGHHQGGSQYWHLVNWWSPIEIQLFYNAR